MKHFVEISDELFDANYVSIIKAVNRHYLTKFSLEDGCYRRGFGAYIRGTDRNAVGGLVGYSELDWMYLDSMYVKEAFRGQGIGRTLMMKAEMVAVARGCRGIKLECYPAEVNFYTKIGYLTYYQEIEVDPERSVLYLKKNI